MKPSDDKHCVDELTAYLDDRLEARRSRQISEHLLACPQCREAFEEVKLGARAALRLPRVEAPESLWEQIESRLDESAEPMGPTPRWPLYAALATAALLVLAVGLQWLNRPSLPGQKVVRLEGSPRVGSQTIGESGFLSEGQWLITDSASRARLEIAELGEVDVDPGTRLRLLKSGQAEHRLSLDQGKIEARIWAPPRLFFVETPAALAVDLGCAYSLEVEPSGAGLLQVTSGWVGLEKDGRDVLVPAGAVCPIDPRQGPRVPFFENATEPFRELVRDLESLRTQPEKLELLLREARPRDAFSLWHLLFRLERPDRLAVYLRMLELSPPPTGVTKEAALSLDLPALLRWRERMERTVLGVLLKNKKKLTPGTLYPIPSMSQARSGHTATPLKDGRVLVTGGKDQSQTLASAEIYFPLKNFFYEIGEMTTARSGHTATLLNEGRVLVTGGAAGDLVLASTELFEPRQRTFAAAAEMAAARTGHRATLLTDGRTLITGGRGADGAELASAEIFDPGSNRFVQVGNMTFARHGHSATLLQDGRVLIVGGGALEAEIFDPETQSFEPGGRAGQFRRGHGAALLADQRVLIFGGRNEGGAALRDSELFDPKTGRFAPFADLHLPRPEISAASLRLSDGRVLISAGADRLEIFEQGSWSLIPGRLEPRTNAASALLPTGQALILGGTRQTGTASSEAWLFQP